MICRICKITTVGHLVIMRTALVSSAFIGWSVAATAQNIISYFPPGNAGYDQQLGVTVLTRARPLYESPGVRIGSFVIFPNLDLGLAYNSNVNGTVGSGSWGTRTSGSVQAGSDWVRDSLSAVVGFTDNQLFSFPNENFVDWNAGLAGGYTIGDGQLSAAYSHQTLRTLGTSLGAIDSQTPAVSETDSANLNYTFHSGDVMIVPDISFSVYRFGPATIRGHLISQAPLNRNVVAGGVYGRYSLSDEGGLIVVLRGANSDFTQPMPGRLSNNSNSLELLSGIDYQGEGVWRWRLLVGMKVREFQASNYATRATPVTEGGVIWTPTGLTTVTGTLSREIQDPETAGTNGAVFTRAGIVVDHELRPNVFLQARGLGAQVEYLQSGGGTQTSISVGAGVSWRLNRNVRVGLSYDFTKQNDISSGSINNNPSNPSALTSGAFDQHVALLNFHVNL